LALGLPARGLRRRRRREQGDGASADRGPTATAGRFTSDDGLACQTGERWRGGRNTAVHWCIGRGSFVSGDKKDGPVEAETGIAGHQAQELIRPSVIPAGMVGAAGCSEQKAPEHGRGPEGTGSGSDGAARSSIKDAVCAEEACRSVRDVTRCEQPARAPGGAITPSARSASKTPAGTEAGR
jgi:hypothetical protein